MLGSCKYIKIYNNQWKFAERVRDIELLLTSRIIIVGINFYVTLDSVLRLSYSQPFDILDTPFGKIGGKGGWGVGVNQNWSEDIYICLPSVLYNMVAFLH